MKFFQQNRFYFVFIYGIIFNNLNAINKDKFIFNKVGVKVDLEQRNGDHAKREAS